MRTIVLRCVQRAHSDRITVSAHLELDGSTYAVAKMNASAINHGGGVLDAAAMGTLVVAVKTQIGAWEPCLPLWGAR